MPGPLPDPKRRRTNAPTFPTTRLPVSGRTGPAPGVPPAIVLGAAGRAWWAWAWSTPQAVAWNLGHHWAIGRRAQLEDVWSAAVQDGSATSALANAMRELEDRLGLTPKGMLAMRWEIVADTPPEGAVPADDPRADEVARRRREREQRLAGG